jgi:uncharacterized protein DUF4157
VRTPHNLLAPAWGLRMRPGNRLARRRRCTWGNRVHIGPQASRIGAVAFTTGSDLYFAPGQFQPDTIKGQQLIGHELAHVIQQRQGRVRTPGHGMAVVQDRALEAEADRMGMRAAALAAPIQRHAVPSKPPTFGGGLAALQPKWGPATVQRSSPAVAPKYTLTAVQKTTPKLRMLGDFAVVEHFKVDAKVNGWVAQEVLRCMKAYLLDNNGAPIKKWTSKEIDGLKGVNGFSRLDGWESYWEYCPVTNGESDDGDQFAMCGINPDPNTDDESGGVFTMVGKAYFTTEDPALRDRWSRDGKGPAGGWPYLQGSGTTPAARRDSNELVRTMKVEWWTMNRARLTTPSGTKDAGSVKFPKIDLSALLISAGQKCP